MNISEPLSSRLIELLNQPLPSVRFRKWVIRDGISSCCVDSILDEFDQISCMFRRLAKNCIPSLELGFTFREQERVGETLKMVIRVLEEMLNV